LGTDLVKDPRVLNAAYNDARGLTRDFNKNVLSVINRELDASFNPDRFRHVAFFNEEASQIEMHLECTASHTVTIESLELELRFSEGERILTDISCIFTRQGVAQLLLGAAYPIAGWFASR